MEIASVASSADRQVPFIPSVLVLALTALAGAMIVPDPRIMLALSLFSGVLSSVAAVLIVLQLRKNSQHAVLIVRPRTRVGRLRLGCVRRRDRGHDAQGGTGVEAVGARVGHPG